MYATRCYNEKSWKLIPKTISGEKTIESRWYKYRYVLWGEIGAGDVVYFKNSGEAVTVKAIVKDVKFYDNLNSDFT